MLPNKMATKLTKRQIALLNIKIDYAKHGKDTGDATRSFIEGGISRSAYNEAARIGMQQYKAQLSGDDTVWCTTKSIKK